MRASQKKTILKIKKTLWDLRSEIEEVGSEIWEDDEDDDEGIPTDLETASNLVQDAIDIMLQTIAEE